MVLLDLAASMFGWKWEHRSWTLEGSYCKLGNQIRRLVCRKYLGSALTFHQWWLRTLLPRQTAHGLTVYYRCWGTHGGDQFHLAGSWSQSRMHRQLTWLHKLQITEHECEGKEVLQEASCGGRREKLFGQPKQILLNLHSITSIFGICWTHHI